MSAAAPSSASGASSPAPSAAKRLQELRARLDRERQSNFAEVGQEDLRRKEDPKQVQKRAREAREAQELLKREELERQGVDIERLERMSTSIAEADHDERRKQKKAKREVTGFSDWEDMARRKYKRLTRSMKPDLEHYEAEKERLGEDFYPDANALSYGLHGKAAPEKVEHMVNDLAKQVDTRKNLSRHRTHDPDADVDYINERNRLFNKWLSRSFDTYTKEIRDSLERGTAL